MFFYWFFAPCNFFFFLRISKFAEEKMMMNCTKLMCWMSIYAHIWEKLFFYSHYLSYCCIWVQLQVLFSYFCCLYLFRFVVSENVVCGYFFGHFSFSMVFLRTQGKGFYVKHTQTSINKKTGSALHHSQISWWYFNGLCFARWWKNLLFCATLYKHWQVILCGLVTRMNMLYTRITGYMWL